MASIPLQPACSTQSRSCSLQFASPSCRAQARCGRRRIVKVQGANTASEKLTEVQDALRLKQVRLQQLVQEESFQQAAQQRDAITQLELDKRRLEIEAYQEAYDNIVHDIGQVIRHKKYEYLGVIVGYDVTCLAPEGWIKAMRVDSLPKGRSQPFYHVLVDNRDSRMPGNVTYVAQENIATVRKQTEVEHPLIDSYFSSFEDGTYVPTESIRKQYPDRSRKQQD